MLLFLIPSDNLCSLIGTFKPLAFTVIGDVVGLISPMFVTVLSLLSTLFMLFVLLTEHFIRFHFCFCIRYWINFFFYFSLVATLEFSSLVSQMVKNLPAMPETRVQSLGQEDPLKKGLATYYSNLAWRISRTEEPGRLQSVEPQRFGHD